MKRSWEGILCSGWGSEPGRRPLPVTPLCPCPLYPSGNVAPYPGRGLPRRPEGRGGRAGRRSFSGKTLQLTFVAGVGERGATMEREDVRGPVVRSLDPQGSLGPVPLPRTGMGRGSRRISAVKRPPSSLRA